MDMEHGTAIGTGRGEGGGDQGTVVWLPSLPVCSRNMETSIKPAFWVRSRVWVGVGLG